MTRIIATKTSFTSGEIDPALFGRIDLRAYEDGAAKLLNVLVQRTGGLARRPGTAFVVGVPSGARMVTFDRGEPNDLLVFGDFAVFVVTEGVLRQTLTEEVNWSVAQLAQASFTLVDDAVLVCHPDIRPRLLRRAVDGTWSVGILEFTMTNADEADERVHQPYARFAPAEVTIQPFRLNPGENPTTAGLRGVGVELRASGPVFEAESPGTIVRLKGRQLRIWGLPINGDGRVAYADTLEPLVDELQTVYWDEQAFSPVHGWPITATVHQSRLVLGGCRDRPDYLWFSRSGSPFDFDFADGDDDGAIAFRISAERRHAIRQLFPGRVLQVFTTAGEWTVSGFPLTAASARVELQTRIGSRPDRQIAPVDVDGATLFVGAAGRDLREFLFTDTEQAYQAADIAILSRHLLRDPVDMAFDHARRVFWIVRGDGRCCAITIDRNSNIVAWSLQETDGSILAAVLHDGALCLLVQREVGLAVERLADDAVLDKCVRLTSPTPRSQWSGLGALIGERCSVIADGEPLGEYLILADDLDVGRAVSVLELGRPFSHVIEGLPIVAVNRGMAPDTPYRPVRVSLRLGPTLAFDLDTGGGYRTVPVGAGQPSGSGGVQDIGVRAMGWRRGVASPPWRLLQQQPGAFNLLSVTVEAKVNG